MSLSNVLSGRGTSEGRWWLCCVRYRFWSSSQGGGNKGGFINMLTVFLSKGTFFKVKRLSHGHTLNSVVWLLWEVKLKGEGEKYLHYYEYLKSLWFLLPSLSFSLF